jgi:Carboxypeptidase regulatory-like domain
MTRVFRAILLISGILVMSAGSANAQANGQIFGKVTDDTGGVLPGVTVTVTGTGLQQPLVATTASSGAFQFPVVPIGTYTVAFELSSFKKASRPNIIITNGFSAEINVKLEVGAMTEEVTVTAAPPVVDTKRTATGGTFTKDILENIPTARDPWQIINMAPGVQLSGVNVGGSESGQQLTPSVYGTSSSVQWNLEGGSITDLSSNSSPSYFNFDSFEQISVTTGGGDVSVQSSGLSINLVTKSGSNVFKGTAVTTFENDKMQGNNVTSSLFSQGAGGLLSGAPLKKITNNSIEYGGPIKRNRLWWWAAADKQDINKGVLNFFDPTAGANCAAYSEAQRTGTLSGTITYDQLDAVAKCLKNDQTIIKDLQWKINYQLNAANKFQYLFDSDNKIRNARSATSTTAVEATFRQYSDSPWKLPLPTHSVTHTLIVTDKLVFNNQYTYVHGGFFLDYQDYDTCGSSRYIPGADTNEPYAHPADCLWNQQQLSLRTTGYQSRAINSTYQTVRHGTELKTDGTYFASNLLGGDHSLKFGVGYRHNPILSFSHYSGGGRAWYECVGNNSANCGDGTFVPVGSATGLVPYRAVLYRDQLRNNSWSTYNGYIQDSYSRGKLRLNGGVRYDWQNSKYLGGCVPANIVVPNNLPSQCEAATSVDPTNGRALQAFSNWAPRISATYDLLGNGKTSVHASYSLYFQTKITLADSLGGLFTQTALTWGSNTSSGACTGSSCWTDANRDGFIQANELTGTPTSSSSRFVNGVLVPAGNAVDPSAKIARTREAIVGVQHELIPNLAVGVDYVYRKYDNGTASYTIGFQPGAASFPLSQIYTGPLTYTDATTGKTAPYYVVCDGCARPSGIGTITMTNLGYSVYNGVILTVNKRYSNRWQLNSSLTLQNNPGYNPTGSYTNPTGVQFQNGVSTLARYNFKANGSYQLPWGLQASANLNVNDGNTRTLTVTGPGNVYGGTTGTINYGTLEFQARDSVRYKSTTLLDAGVQKVIAFGGGRYRLKLMADAFNITNINTVRSYSSSNLSLATSSQISGIVAPRVFRISAQINF